MAPENLFFIVFQFFLNAITSYFTSQRGMEPEFKIIAKNRTLDVFDQVRERLWQGPFFFLQAADTQFGMIETYIEHREDPGWQQEITLARKMVKAANAMSPRPRFIIICGDLVDAFPGAPKKDAQVKDFKKVFEELDNRIPLVCVCGNHDIGMQPTQDSIQLYHRQFGDDYFSFLCGGVKFVVLNSQFYEDPSKVVELAEAHDSWLDSELADANYRHLVIFQHIPWFLTRPDEPKQYFNIDPDLRAKMLKKFKKAGVRAIFCGHYHRNAGGWDGNMELVVTSAVGAQLGDDASGLRVVQVSETTITHNYYPLDEIPSKVDLNAIG